MRKIKSWVLVLGVALSFQGWGDVLCHNENALACIDIVNKSDYPRGHYVSVAANHPSERAVFCTVGNNYSFISLNQEELSSLSERSMDVPRYGHNTIQFTQCKDKACTEEKPIGQYDFFVDPNANATPARFTLSLDDGYGDTCSDWE